MGSLVSLVMSDIVDSTRRRNAAEVASARTDAGEPVVQRTELPPIHDEQVGRSDELAAIWEALSRSQLLTMVGVG